MKESLIIFFYQTKVYLRVNCSLFLVAHHFLKQELFRKTVMTHLN